MPSHSSFKLSCLWLFFKRTFQNTTVLHKFHLKIARQSWITCICQRFKKWKGQNQMVFWKGPNIQDRGLKKPKQTTNTKTPTLLLFTLLGRLEHGQHKRAGGTEQAVGWRDLIFQHQHWFPPGESDHITIALLGSNVGRVKHLIA